MPSLRILIISSKQKKSIQFFQKTLIFPFDGNAAFFDIGIIDFNHRCFISGTIHEIIREFIAHRQQKFTKKQKNRKNSDSI